MYRPANETTDQLWVEGRSVSRGEIFRDENGWNIKDLGSTNGTMVDGRLVREVALTAGSEITVGSARMVLFVASEEELGDSAESQESPRPGRVSSRQSADLWTGR